MKTAATLTGAMLALTAILSATVAGAAGPPFNPSMLPTPRLEPEALPDDGSGVYRISLHRALGPMSLPLLLHVRDGRVTAAAVVPQLMAPDTDWWRCEPGDLSLTDGRLRGTIALTTYAPFDSNRHGRFHKGKDLANPDFAPYVLEAQSNAKLVLDVGLDGGSYTLEWSDGGIPRFGSSQPVKGSVSVLAFPHRPLPAIHECSFYAEYGLANAPIWNRAAAPWLGPVQIRLARRADGRVEASGRALARDMKWFDLKDAGMEIGDDSFRIALTSALDGSTGPDFSLVIEGPRLGHRLLGTLTCKVGEHELSTQAVGLLHDLRDARLRLDETETVWDWTNDRQVDEDLVARAAREYLQPVMPGDPGVHGFWTWRRMVGKNPIPSAATCDAGSFLYPPSFDIKAVEGAVRYRYDISRKGHGDAVIAGFEADKPWLPLAPIWGDLEPAPGRGSYSLQVTGIDAQGNDLPGPMRMGVYSRKELLKPIEVERGHIFFAKRHPFDGVRLDPAHGWQDAALALSRVRRDHWTLVDERGETFSNQNHWFAGGDNSFACVFAARTWAALAARSLATDPAERRLAEEQLARNLEDVEAHLNGKPRVIRGYQGITVLAHWAMEAMCDAWLQTGDQRWNQAAVLAARGLAAVQAPNGGFYDEHRDPPRGGKGYYETWRPAELLYALGRIRRDLGTDEFLEVERKAYQRVLEAQVKERDWPLSVSHSASPSYPVWQHPVGAWYFCRYLLELAPESERDLALATEVARWGEDYRIEWGDGKHPKYPERIYPRIDAGDRYNNQPITSGMLAAVVFESLAQATGDEVWRAKGQALAHAVTHSISPDGTMAGMEVMTTPQLGSSKFQHSNFGLGWAAQLLREYAALQRQSTASSE